MCWPNMVAIKVPEPSTARAQGSNVRAVQGLYRPFCDKKEEWTCFKQFSKWTKLGYSTVRAQQRQRLLADGAAETLLQLPAERKHNCCGMWQWKWLLHTKGANETKVQRMVFATPGTRFCDAGQWMRLLIFKINVILRVLCTISLQTRLRYRLQGFESRKDSTFLSQGSLQCSQVPDPRSSH
jgi:hypothetical protein